eukprot:1111031-Pleurochrysis_carterae.AAC.2
MRRAVRAGVHMASCMSSQRELNSSFTTQASPPPRQLVFCRFDCVLIVCKREAPANIKEQQPASNKQIEGVQRRRHTLGKRSK